MREHFTLPGTIYITRANFSFKLSTWRLPIYLKMGEQFFGLRCRISHPVFSVFYTYCQRLKYILLFLHLRYFLLLPRTVSHQAGSFSACIGTMNFWIEVPRASMYKHRGENRASTLLQVSEGHCCNHMRYARHQIRAACTQPSSRNCNVRIHAVAFDLSSIHEASFKPLPPLSRTSTSSYSRRCTDAAAPGRRYAREAKGPTRWIQGENREMIKFFSPALWIFSPCGWCFLQVQAQGMYPQRRHRSQHSRRPHAAPAPQVSRPVLALPSILRGGGRGLGWARGGLE